MMFRWDDPWLLLLLVLPLALLVRPSSQGGVAHSGFAVAIACLRPARLPWLWRLLAASGLACLVIAAARPQYGRSLAVRTAEGRDLVLVMDLSYSMTTDDIFAEDGERLDRLRAVNAAAERFIAGRPNDRIGLVFFGNHALLACPPTHDHQTVLDFIRRTEEQQRERWRDGPDGLLGPGTNIGQGLGRALAAIEKTPRGRAILVITDGRDTPAQALEGQAVDPVEAARRCQALGVRVHAISVGDPEGTRTDFEHLMRTGVRRFVPTSYPRGMFLPDPERLREIVGVSGGVSLAANDRAGLERMLERIDELEPSPRQVAIHDDFEDRYPAWLLAGFLLLLLARIVETPWRGGP
jgi:Ca-activated chloride channel family protein